MYNTYIRTYVHTYIRTYAHTYTRTYIRTCVCMCMYTQVCYILTFVRAVVRKHTSCIYIYIYLYVCMCIYIYIYIYIHIYTHMHNIPICIYIYVRMYVRHAIFQQGQLTRSIQQTNHLERYTVMYELELVSWICEHGNLFICRWDDQGWGGDPMRVHRGVPWKRHREHTRRYIQHVVFYP